MFTYGPLLEKLQAPGGVYSIRCISSGKIYIGSSKDIKKRARQHEAALKMGKHANKKLQLDYNGGKDFFFDAVRVLVDPTHRALIRAEYEVMKEAKRGGADLYNMLELTQPMSDFSIRNMIIHILADLYCKQTYGKSVDAFLIGSDARREMILDCLLTPDNAEKIRAEYEPAIKTMNLVNYYKRFGVDYEKCAINAELNHASIKDEIKKEMLNNKPA